MKMLFTYDDKIVSLLQNISKMEGELQGIARSFKSEEQIFSQAAIEAVHYSTKIEGNPLTLKQVTSALIDNKTKVGNQRDVKEIINYAKARAKIIKMAQKEKIISNKFILEIHDVLMKGIVKGKLKGHYREAQNVIKDSKSKEIVYIPPEWRDVKKLMKQLISWANTSLIEEKNPLIISALFHYQFVTIHPFMDGNGRMARLISNYIILANNHNVIQYSALEKQHEKDRKNYYQLLKQHQGQTFYDIAEDIDLSDWLKYWLKCLQDTYKEALSRIEPKNKMPPHDEYQDLPERLKLAIGFFQKHNKLKTAEYESIIGLSRTQAVEDLNKLMELGYIKKIGGGRSTVYQIKNKKN